MAFIPIPNTAKAALAFSFTGQRVVITLHFKLATDYLTFDLTDLAGKLVTWWTSHMWTNFGTGLTLTDVTATALHNATAPSFTNVLVAPFAGGGGAGILGNGEAVVITNRTALRGRNFRGRTYLPGVAGAIRADPGRITLAGTGFLVAGMAKLFDPLVIGAHTLVIASRQVNNVARIVGITTPVTAFSCDQNIDSQRRRLIGRGA